MKIVFFGSNNTGWLSLKEIIDMKENVVGIFTMPKVFNISYSDSSVQVVTHRSFSEFEERYGIPIVIIDNKMKHYIQDLQKLKPDLCIVSGWYYMIPKEMLSIPTKGFVGFHPSLLPKYRGGAPVNWAIINGEKKSGMSMFYFDDGVDSGDIIAQREVDINPDDTIKEVYDKINQATVDIIRKHIPLLRQGKAPRILQDHNKATYFPQRKPEDGEIDWSLPAKKIYNWIRAQTLPYPGAFTYHKGNILKIWSSIVEDTDSTMNDEYQPGIVIDNSYKKQGFLLSTGDKGKAILIKKVGTEKIKFMEAIDYVQREGLVKGEILGKR